MNSRYSYDEKADTWPVFVLAVASVAVVPVTLGSLYGLAFGGEKSEGPVDGSIDVKDSDFIPIEVKEYRSKSKKKPFFTKKNLFLIFGWFLIIGLIFHIKTHEVESVTTNFDPYEILGIDFGSTEKEIKSHFRKLSVKFHPDKIAKDLSDEEKSELEDKFVLISKAYQALTDETIKENYEKYGHPDGPQETSHGIALPKFLIEGKLSSPILLSLYILIIGFILPSIVSSWWNSTRAYTKKGIHNETAAFFVERLLNYNPSKILKLSDILNWLSKTYELKEFGSEEEVLVILNKYLDRNSKLSYEELKLISKVPTLLLGLIDITTSFKNTEITLLVIQVYKQFSQALKDSNKNDLLQLPNVNAKSIEDSKISKLGKLFTLSNDEIKSTLGIENDTKLKETLSVAEKIPNLELIKAEFKVAGESVVTPSSNSYISIKFLVKSPKHHGVSQYSKDKLIEEETFENLKDPFKIVSEQPLLPISYSTYSPNLKHSSYIALVVLQKDNKIAEIPSLFQNLDLSNLDLTNEEYLNGEKVKVGTFKIPFTQPTPNEVGSYQFRVIIKSLDYFANDIDTTVIMKVENPPKIEEVDYDIPDPDEDSIAGALATMKGEKVNKIEDDSSDEESDLEDDFTDINTDTEDEDN